MSDFLKHLHVKYLDGREIDIVAGPRARVEVERRFDMSFAKAFGKADVRDEHFYVLAWAALHFSDKEDADFDDWLALIEDVDVKVPDAGEGDGSEASPAGRPYEAGSEARRLVVLSINTGIPFKALLAEDDQTLATYFDVIDKRLQAQESEAEE